MVNTRAANATTHPGDIVLAQTKPRRSSQVVAAARLEEDEARQAVAALKSKKLERIAAMQLEAQRQDNLRAGPPQPSLVLKIPARVSASQPEGSLSGPIASTPRISTAKAQQPKVSAKPKPITRDDVTLKHQLLAGSLKAGAIIDLTIQLQMAAAKSPATGSSLTDAEWQEVIERRAEKGRKRAAASALDSSEPNARAVLVEYPFKTTSESHSQLSMLSKKAKAAAPLGLARKTPAKPSTVVLARTSVGADVRREVEITPGASLGVVAFGGFVDDDEELEVGPGPGDIEDDAQVSSGTRTTSQGMVSVVAVVPVSNGTVALVTAQGKFKISELPLGALSRWRGMFLPKLRALFGVALTPWENSSTVVRIAMQDLWDEVYPDIPHVVEPGEAVNGLALQKIYEWRGKFASAAAEAVARAFEDNEELTDDDARAAYVETAVGAGMPFVYARTKPKHAGLFQSALILEVLSVVHLLLICGHVSLEEYLAKPPVSATTLATVAVERELRLWSSGQRLNLKPEPDTPGDKSLNFSCDNWSQETTQYVKSVVKLSQRTWRAIILGASLYSKGTRAPKLVAAALVINDSDEDDRGMIADDESESDAGWEGDGAEDLE